MFAQMGKATAVWLVPLATSPLASGTVSSTDGLSDEELLRVWVKVALARELNASTKFEVHVNSGGESASVASVAGSEATSGSGSTGTGSRGVRRNSKRASTIMPFRADSCECLFLS